MRGRGWLGVAAAAGQARGARGRGAAGHARRQPRPRPPTSRPFTGMVVGSCALTSSIIWIARASLSRLLGGGGVCRTRCAEGGGQPAELGPAATVHAATRGRMPPDCLAAHAGGVCSWRRRGPLPLWWLSDTAAGGRVGCGQQPAALWGPGRGPPHHQLQLLDQLLELWVVQRGRAGHPPSPAAGCGCTPQGDLQSAAAKPLWVRAAQPR